MGREVSGVLRKNEIGRWCIIDPDDRRELIELTSGSCLELIVDGQWIKTRIEHGENGYYAVGGYSLCKDMPARIADY